MEYEAGSIWRKWDLHVHTLGTAKADQFKSKSLGEFCALLFRRAIDREIASIGITDYFSIENYNKISGFQQRIDEISDFSSEDKSRIKQILLIPNVELRMMPATQSGRLLNIHCLFNPEIVDKLDNVFFSSLDFAAGGRESYKMNRKGIIDLGKSMDSKLDDESAYKKGISEFVVTRDALENLLNKSKEFRENVIIVVSNSSRDGASGLQQHYDFFEGTAISSLDGVRRAIYRISDAIFSGNPKDGEYFVGRGKDDEKSVSTKCGSLKPCLHGSDAHSEDRLFNPEENRFCWIKADLTFDGLKQILYEPFPGERVFIGPNAPDQKDEFKVIKNIRFDSETDFPKAISFNQNLCSIIGSRSSGKSALLAYLADAIDVTQARHKKESGPGEGFSWDEVEFDYKVEWANNKFNSESPGKILYLPQNYLYEMSTKPQEIKNKIRPVLDRELPSIGKSHTQVERSIKGINEEINKAVEKWFDIRTEIDEKKEESKNLGSKKSVQSEKNKLARKISRIEKLYKLEAEDLELYQEVLEGISDKQQKIEQLDEEIEQIEDYKDGETYVTSVQITLKPSINTLPRGLQEIINKSIDKHQNELISEANEHITNFRKEKEKEKIGLADSIKLLETENRELLKSHEKNEELKPIIKKRNEHTKTIKKISGLEKTIKELRTQAEKVQSQISEKLNERRRLITNLIEQIEQIDQIDQSTIREMQFNIEAEISEPAIERVHQIINLKETTDYVSRYEFDIIKSREDVGKFLTAIYAGTQKIIKGNEKLDVAQVILETTEEILFSAEMEGDKIGGFSEPTMTPGKRALFALRLILAESEDTWPLLIDQPEDDLDSRSIFDEIMPFLREKKKERQIIMVSHNANFVVGADSEQIIVANRHGEDRKNTDGFQFNYLTGSIENTKKRDKRITDTLKAQGIREHGCEILEGGEKAFEQRRNRYGLG